MTNYQHTTGLVSLTDRDLQVLAAAMQVAYGGEEPWNDMFTEAEVDECFQRIQQGIEEAKTW